MATESGAENAKKRNIFVRIGLWFKAAALELKKTTWPKGKEILKKLGIVLIVVAFFFLILMGMDLLLQLGYKGLTSGLPAPKAPPATAGQFSGILGMFKFPGL